MNGPLQAFEMCVTAFVSAINSSVGMVVSIGSKLVVRYCAESRSRAILSVATILCREGIKLKMNTWINKKIKNRRAKIFNSVKMTLSKSFKWCKKEKQSTHNIITMHSKGDDDTIAVEAALKLQGLTEKRLEAARKSVQAAAIELHNAETEFEDAKRYVKYVKSQCSKAPQIKRCRSGSDIVFVEHPSKL